MRFCLFGTIVAAVLSSGCDPQAEIKHSCNWYLMPNIVRQPQVDEGYIPVCARNLKDGVEDCRLQTTYKFATRTQGRPFRYTDLSVKDFGLPRTILSIKFCD